MPHFRATPALLRDFRFQGLATSGRAMRYYRADILGRARHDDVREADDDAMRDMGMGLMMTRA